MLSTRMKSQPQYLPLEWDRSGRQHIVQRNATDDRAQCGRGDTRCRRFKVPDLQY